MHQVIKHLEALQWKIMHIFCFWFFFLNRRSDGDTKAAESTKRKLSADLAVNKSHLDIKKRDGKSYLS